MTPAPTPTLTPTPASSLTGSINWDAVSACADVAMAIGAFLSLYFLIRTFRAQAGTLDLQKKQIDELAKSKEEDRLLDLQNQHERRKRQAQDVRVVAIQIHPEPSTYLHELERSNVRRLRTLLQETLASELPAACAVEVRNDGSGIDLQSVKPFGYGLPRPDYVWKASSKILVQEYEIDLLPHRNSVTFIWLNLQVRDLEESRTAIHFSGEDGGRWSKDLHDRLERIDDLTDPPGHLR